MLNSLLTNIKKVTKNQTKVTLQMNQIQTTNNHLNDMVGSEDILVALSRFSTSDTAVEYIADVMDLSPSDVPRWKKLYSEMTEQDQQYMHSHIRQLLIVFGFHENSKIGFECILTLIPNLSFDTYESLRWILRSSNNWDTFLIPFINDICHDKIYKPCDLPDEEPACDGLTNDVIVAFTTAKKSL